ncbi:cytosol aminopeptidase-like [Drosophila miranda]|uniref:cytosol aminopeptidase-like n=1 Tax=Drosophila miranda TaxID=7229 RepID=UPI00143F368B|nr:cytosol aminopeptidase-like [Drosophila miranda]
MKSVRLMHALCRRVQHTFLARRRDVEQRRHYAEKCDSVIKGVVVGVYAKKGDRQPKMTPSGEKFDDRVQGKITDLIRETGLSAQLGKGRVFMNVDAEFRAVAVVGVGQEGAGFNDLEMIDEGMENASVAADVGARALQLQGCTDVFVESMDCTDSDAWMRGLFKAESQNLARRLADTPANQMTPTIFAQSTVDALCHCGVSVEVRSMDWIESKILNSFLMVAKGSCEPPIILEIAYCGTAPEDKPILLLGKGITFNSGGLCLRPKDCLSMYRGCMSGAAACFEKVGPLTGDRVWRLPLWRYFKELIMPNETFDISTRGRGPASSCIAAAVLHELVPCVDWAHLDIRNVGMLTRYNPLPYLLKDRMTGRPTRTIVLFLFQMACPDGK